MSGKTVDRHIIYRVAERALLNLGWKSKEIEEALTAVRDDFGRLRTPVIDSLAEADKNQFTEIIRELHEERMSRIAEANGIPSHPRMVDFKCSECQHEMRDELVEVPEGYELSRLTMTCNACGYDARYFIPPGTRLAVLGEENVPKEQLYAARNALVRGAKGRVEPFTGETRSELKQWEAKNDVSAMSGDEASRGKSVINSKPKFTQTKEFEERLAQSVIEADEITAAGGDRLAERKSQIERPDQYDTSTFKEQVETDVVGGAVAGIPVEAVAEEI